MPDVNFILLFLFLLFYLSIYYYLSFLFIHLFFPAKESSLKVPKAAFLQER